LQRNETSCDTAREAKDQLAHKGLVGYSIQRRQPRPDKPQPNLAVHSAHHVVRRAREVVKQDGGLGRNLGDIQVRGGDVDLPHAVPAGLSDEQRSFVAAEFRREFVF
jgi:hypothetical protein